MAVSTTASQLSLMCYNSSFVQFNSLQSADRSILGDCSSFDDELNALRILSHKSININSNESKSFLNVEAVFHSDVLSEVKDVLVNTFNMCITIANSTNSINSRRPPSRAELFQGKRIFLTLNLSSQKN